MKFLPLDVYDVSSQNKYKIIKHLLSATPHSRGDSAKTLNLSSVTVGKIACPMLDGGILVAEKTSGGVGRSTELLCASPALCVLVINLGSLAFSAYLVTLDGAETTLYKHPRNQSCSYAEDINVFLSTTERKLNELSSNTIIGVFVSYYDKHPAELGVSIGSALGTEPDVIMHSQEALGIAYKNRGIDIALHIDISETVKPMLFVGGKSISRTAVGYTPKEANEYDIALELAQYLKSLFKATVPNTIAIDSESVTADKRFFELVASKASDIEDVPQGYFPTVIDQRNASLISEAALDVITELYAKRLANIID